MRYVVHLCQQPVPATVDHAETLLHELRQQLRFVPDSAASELLSEIGSSLPAGSDGSVCWSAPPEPDADGLVFSLSPALAELDVVLPTIEAAARRRGWVVFDPQSGEARLPDGRVLSRKGMRAETPGTVPIRDLKFAGDAKGLAAASPGAGVHTAGLAASADAVDRRAAERFSLYDGVVLEWLDSLSSLQELERWVRRVPDDDCALLGLRLRGGRNRLLNHHPDLLLAAAVDAPDFEQRARERVARYEADAFGRGLLPQLRSLLAICGLQDGLR